MFGLTLQALLASQGCSVFMLKACNRGKPDLCPKSDSQLFEAVSKTWKRPYLGQDGRDITNILGDPGVTLESIFEFANSMLLKNEPCSRSIR